MGELGVVIIEIIHQIYKKVNSSEHKLLDNSYTSPPYVLYLVLKRSAHGSGLVEGNSILPDLSEEFL